MTQQINPPSGELGGDRNVVVIDSIVQPANCGPDTILYNINNPAPVKCQSNFFIFPDYVAKKIKMSDRERLLQELLETDVDFWNHEFRLCLRDFDVRYIPHTGLYRLNSRTNNRWKGKKIYIDLSGLVTIPEDSFWMTFPRFIAMTYNHYFDDQSYLMLIGAKKTGNKKATEWVDRHEAAVDTRLAKEWQEERKSWNNLPTICEPKKQIKNYIREDLSGLKSQLRRYLHLKGIQIDTKTRPPLLHCLNHDDQHPSAVLYDNQDTPVIFCPVCGRSFDVFNMAGLILKTSDFKTQLADVRRTLGVM